MPTDMWAVFKSAHGCSFCSSGHRWHLGSHPVADLASLRKPGLYTEAKKTQTRSKGLPCPHHHLLASPQAQAGSLEEPTRQKTRPTYKETSPNRLWVPILASSRVSAPLPLTQCMFMEAPRSLGGGIQGSPSSFLRWSLAILSFIFYNILPGHFHVMPFSPGSHRQRNSSTSLLWSLLLQP